MAIPIKAKEGLTVEERRELRQIRSSLINAGMPPELVRRKLIYYRKIIIEGRETHERKAA